MNVIITASMTILFCCHSSFAQVRNIIINEFMFDPSPSIGLPEAEYVELLNVSAEAVDLSGWTLNERPIPGFMLMPGQLMVLCELDAVNIFHQSVPRTGLESWDRLNNEGQMIILKDAQGRIVDSLEYTADWITDPLKKYGGWSLERIDPFRICSDLHNWSVSLNLYGGTPGFINSVFSTLQDKKPPEVKSAECIDVHSIRIKFTETVDFYSNNPDDFFTILPDKQIIQFQHTGFSDTKVIHFTTPMDSGMIYHLYIRNIADC